MSTERTPADYEDRKADASPATAGEQMECPRCKEPNPIECPNCEYDWRYRELFEAACATVDECLADCPDLEQSESAAMPEGLRSLLRIVRLLRIEPDDECMICPKCDGTGVQDDIGGEPDERLTSHCSECEGKGAVRV